MTSKISQDSQIIADEIHSAAIHLLRKLRREDSQSGLNSQRLSALSVVVFGGPVTLGDLAAAEQVRPPTMTRIVDALAELGLVTKTRNASDARSTHITTTAAGRKLLIQGRERRVRALAMQIAKLNAKQQAALQDAAKILKQVIEAI
jgi:DNA-binding MarR family transcriptional regulator